MLPGSGQLILRQDRAIAYLAMEAFVGVQFARDRAEARRQRDAYRTLARTVARALFDEGGLPEGNFEYYERMEKYTESGVYDLVPGGGVEPESDETTFNGAVWRLARETFWEDPVVTPAETSLEYRRALGFYLRRAVPPEFRWTWRNAQLEQDLFVRTIDASNRAFRRTIGDLGVLLANHVLSTVDGYITVRLRWRANAPASPQQEPEAAFVEASIPWSPAGRR
jgi:hypothetical protein